MQQRLKVADGPRKHCVSFVGPFSGRLSSGLEVSSRIGRRSQDIVVWCWCIENMLVFVRHTWEGSQHIGGKVMAILAVRTLIFLFLQLVQPVDGLP